MWKVRKEKLRLKLTAPLLTDGCLSTLSSLHRRTWSGIANLSGTLYGLHCGKERCSMNARHEELEEASKWVKVAEDDLRSAEYLLTMGDSSPFNVVCFL